MIQLRHIYVKMRTTNIQCFIISADQNEHEMFYVQYSDNKWIKYSFKRLRE